MCLPSRPIWDRCRQGSTRRSVDIGMRRRGWTRRRELRITQQTPSKQCTFAWVPPWREKQRLLLAPEGSWYNMPNSVSDDAISRAIQLQNIDAIQKIEG